MPTPKRYTPKERMRSFRFAIEGLRTLFSQEPNALIHLAAAVIVVIAGFGFGVSPWEWALLVFAIGFVFAAELFNTAIEQAVDYISTEKHPQAKKIKDLSAAGVLVAAITAVIIGLVVFVPHLGR